MGSFGKFEISGLKELKERLEEARQGELEAFIERCAKILAARLLAAAVKATPVGVYEGTGKVGGTLRRGWTGGRDGDAAAYAYSIPITKTGNIYKIEIINPVEYASYVEYGHRTVKKEGYGWAEGRFMLTKSEQELERAAPSMLEAEIKKFLEGCMK